MWLCGAIGSKDAAYAKQLLNGTLVQRVAGQTSCFGDPALSDQYYYYNQSLAMLGFAAFTGMFPNVLADDIKTYVKTSEAPNMAGPSGRFSAKALPAASDFRFRKALPVGDRFLPLCTIRAVKRRFRVRLTRAFPERRR